MEIPLLQPLHNYKEKVKGEEEEVEAGTSFSFPVSILKKKKDGDGSGGGNRQHVLHPMSGGAINCFLAVDNVLRATTDLGTPRKISLAPIGSPTEEDIDADNNKLFYPLQNTRHLFVREYNKPFTWPTRATYSSKRYQILNSAGDCIYYAAESSLFLNKLPFLRGMFPYTIDILSVDGENVMEIRGRPLSKERVTIKDSNGHTMGTIRTKFNYLSQSFSLHAWNGTEILAIVGPDGSSCCLFADCTGDDFTVYLGSGVGGASIGKISTDWEYVLEDMCGLFVPMKLDEMTMSLLLSAVFLVDSTYYQAKKDASCMGRCCLTFMFVGLFIILLFLIARK